MKWRIFLFAVLFCFGCEKKAVNIDPEWEGHWVYAYDDSQSLTISNNGWALYDTERGKNRGFARIENKTLKIGLMGRFLIMKSPHISEYNRWEIEIDNMQFLRK